MEKHKRIRDQTADQPSIPITVRRVVSFFSVSGDNDFSEEKATSRRPDEKVTHEQSMIQGGTNTICT